MKYTIYALLDPRGRRAVYVGCTKLLIQSRLSHHVAFSKSPYANARVYRWIRALSKQNVRPVIFPLDETNDNTSGLAESKWMHYFKVAGAKLLNHNNTDYGRYVGGEGSVLYNPKEDARLAMLYPDCPVNMGFGKGKRSVTIIPELQ